MQFSKTHYDTIVIGGGQAGLVCGYYLQQTDQDFVILDGSERVGDSWRKRWDTMKLFTPAKVCGLPGAPFPAEPNHYPGKDEVAEYLEDYARRFNLPVQLSTWVERLEEGETGYVVETSRGTLTAAQVIVATGAFPHTKVPAFSDEIDPGIRQLHSSEYRNPESLAGERVLIVGAGSSGSQIALDMAAEKEVWLAGRFTGHVPQRLLGLFEPSWLLLNTLLNVPVTTALGRKIKQKVMSMGTPVEGVKEEDFAAAGIERLPRVSEVEGGLPTFEDGSTLKPDVLLWATGYQLNFDWIDMPIFDEHGAPMQTRGVVHDKRGLYFVGLPFLHKGKSPILPGVSEDAAYIVDHIQTQTNVVPQKEQAEIVFA
ncbi:MAG: flavin-containing monooxygenase [Anaerolineales bacterium]